MCPKRVEAVKRCPECNLNRVWCICQKIQAVELSNTKVSIIMHHREQHLTSNTAQILARCLLDSQVYTRGQKNCLLKDNFEFHQGYTPLYLFPHEGAVELTRDYLESLQAKKYQLIIPDGTWSQAQKIYKREAQLFENVPCVKLAGNYTSTYELRKQHRSGGVCTMEAGIYALGVLEGQEVENNLMNIFHEVISTIKTSRTGPTERFKSHKQIR